MLLFVVVVVLFPFIDTIIRKTLAKYQVNMHLYNPKCSNEVILLK